MKIEFKKGESKIAIGGRTVSLIAPVWSVFEYKERFLVTVNPDFGRRNVFCYDFQGDLIWTIEATEFFKNDVNHGYNGVYLAEAGELNGRLLAVMFDRPFFLDIQTGEVETIPGNFDDRFT